MASNESATGTVGLGFGVEADMLCAFSLRKWSLNDVVWLCCNSHSQMWVFLGWIVSRWRIFFWLAENLIFPGE